MDRWFLRKSTGEAAETGSAAAAAETGSAAAAGLLVAHELADDGSATDGRARRERSSAAGDTAVVEEMFETLGRGAELPLS